MDVDPTTPTRWPSPTEGAPHGIVILSIFDWWYHSHGHSDIQLAQALSRKAPVLFVNSIGMRFPRPGTASSPIQRIARKLRSAMRRVTVPDPAQRLAIATPFSLPVYSGLLGKLNNQLVKSQINRLTKRFGFVKPLVIVTVPTYAPVALQLARGALIYNRSDKHSEFRGANKKTIEGLELTLFRRADVVLYANRRFYDQEKDKASGQAVFIGHGVDTNLFTRTGPVSPELLAIPQPRVGYFGTLCKEAIDFALIAAVARLRPDVHLVFGGHQLGDLAQLRQFPNVHVLGPCPHAEMPARWRGLDAAIMPYPLTAWHDASEPVKLNEILAIGLRAVATRVPALANHPKSIMIADDPPSFAEKLQQIIAAPRTSAVPRNDAGLRAQSFNSWDSIADVICQLGRTARDRSGLFR